jgi:rod shape-determining protein MreB
VNTKNPSVANHIINAVLSHVRNNKDPLISTPYPASDATDRDIDSPAQKFSGDDTTPPLGCDVDRSILHVGLDWGASKTSLQAAFAGSDELLVDECIPTVLGYAKDGIIDGVLPDNATTLFGREALTHRRYLHLTCPTLDSAASSDFARHLRSHLAIAPAAEIRAVIAVPANCDATVRENIRNAIAEHFQSVILLPQPFLAALGYRDETRLLEPDYIDPVRNSIFIDIGAAMTSLCLVQGYFPSADEQITIPFGGNDLDELLRTAILDNHPYAELSPITVRHLKEQHSFIGPSTSPVTAEVVIAGKPRALDLTAEINAACSNLLTRIFEAIKALITQAPNDSVPDLLANIILTGGGSRIKNIDTELQRLLRDEGYLNPGVTLAGANYKHLTAAGALKTARQAREHHWQIVTRL